MTFRDLYLGQRFLHRDPKTNEWFYYRKLDDTHARASTPLGQDHGAPLTFFATEEVRPDI